MEYPINKGVGKPLEFKGFRAQYLYILAFGVVGLFLLFVMLRLLLIPPMISGGIVVVASVSFFYIVAKMNRKYGANGLKKRIAYTRQPKNIKNTSKIKDFLWK